MRKAQDPNQTSYHHSLTREIRMEPVRALVFRFDPEKDQKPRYVQYDVEWERKPTL